MPYCIKRLDCKEFNPERCEENGSYGCFLEREQSHPTYEADVRFNNLLCDTPLYAAINQLMAHIGAYGEIDSRHGLVTGVMNELHKIDNGVFKQSDI